MTEVDAREQSCLIVDHKHDLATIIESLPRLAGATASYKTEWPKRPLVLTCFFHRTGSPLSLSTLRAVRYGPKSGEIERGLVTRGTLSWACDPSWRIAYTSP